MDYEGSVENMPKSPIVLFQEDRLVETISLESNLLMVSDDKERINYLLKELRLYGELKNKISSSDTMSWIINPIVPKSVTI